MTELPLNYESNTAFSKVTPGLQLAWDSTSLGTFKECPRKYYYTMVMGRNTRGESVHLTFGAHYHKALETYDHARSAGASYEDGVDAAVRYCLEATVDRDANDPSKWRPWNSDDTNKNRYTLVRTVVWYLIQFKDDPLRTIQLANGKPAVELSFRYNAGVWTQAGEEFLLCGHLDRLVEEPNSGKLFVLDRKTTKNTLYAEFFKKFSPDNQMSLYDFSSNVVWSVPVQGVVIDAVQIAVSFSKFLRGHTLRKPDQREEWMRDTEFYLRLAERFALAGYWPMNDKSCDHWGGCPFREVCSKAPSTRMQWLKGLTVPRVWDPLQVRGDI